MTRARQPGEKRLREAVIETAREMSRSGLSPGRTGNVSCRFEDGMLITPSGKRYDETKPADIVFVSGEGNIFDARQIPSTEWHFHLAAYHARPDRNAIVHTHSMHATVLACAHKSIPAFHYMVAAAGGKNIPCVPYATFGTAELAHHVAEGLRDRDACLMANHGQIAIGKTLQHALELAAEIEILAEQYYKVLTLGSAKLLDDREMSSLLKKFRTYGRNTES
ncbi:class II aldolase/adducin family protein [Hyphomicrobium sp.]|jgi:L-fuculose-phosphate aldolase|uniref:class II aldolase/adducin family protein n=1 Tax=Hyphomicrobium sp. TaxID=82 RepID=UPI002D0C6A89|nr:class II aldolase/adducin family protein [Hyphomicrobium sp.]HVZ03523.1 class II aldolase/adducin family protein [Hyphomicrobium sp.]